MRDYLPRNQSELLGWAKTFASRVEAAPQDYGLRPDVAQEIAAAVNAYAQAFGLASTRATRTQAHVLTKNKARTEMVKLLRPVVQQIRANTAVGEALKVGIGIRLPGRSLSAAGEPPALSGRPQLHIASVLPRRHVLGYTRMEGEGKAKPAGAIGLQLFVHVGDTPPEDPADARFLRFLSRAPYAVDFKAEQVGKTAFYFARWQTATGETGPWSQVLKMTVAG